LILASDQESIGGDNQCANVTLAQHGETTADLPFVARAQDDEF
jgi:hypothetical protein